MELFDNTNFAYEEGFLDGELWSGLSSHDTEPNCPYAVGTDEFKEWWDGYEDGRDI